MKLILCFPFVAAIVCLIMCVRALLTGEMKTGGGRTRVKTITRAVNPIQFWIQIVLLCLVTGFLILLGLFLFDAGPAWFHDAMLSRGRTRSPR